MSRTKRSNKQPNLSRVRQELLGIAAGLSKVRQHEFGVRLAADLDLNIELVSTRWLVMNCEPTRKGLPTSSVELRLRAAMVRMVRHQPKLRYVPCKDNAKQIRRLDATAVAGVRTRTIDSASGML